MGKKIHSGLWIILESVLIALFCLVTETKEQTFWGIAGLYSTICAVDYTAVIFSTHLVTMKCKIFTTTSTREIQLCVWPATQLTHSALLPANRVHQSIAHAWRFNWKGSIGITSIHVWGDNLIKKKKSLSSNCFDFSKEIIVIETLILGFWISLFAV